METQNIEKREYSAPLIERIQLDNEISLALESTPSDVPPLGPGGFGQAEHFNNDPFHTNIA
jgi:hypothetical protein